MLHASEAERMTARRSASTLDPLVDGEDESVRVTAALAATDSKVPDIQVIARRVPEATGRLLARSPLALRVLAAAQEQHGHSQRECDQHDAGRERATSSDRGDASYFLSHI
jgi:hypothetical protein